MRAGAIPRICFPRPRYLRPNLKEGKLTYCHVFIGWYGMVRNLAFSLVRATFDLTSIAVESIASVGDAVTVKFRAFGTSGAKVATS